MQTAGSHSAGASISTGVPRGASARGNTFGVVTTAKAGQDLGAGAATVDEAEVSLENGSRMYAHRIL